MVLIRVWFISKKDVIYINSSTFGFAWEFLVIVRVWFVMKERCL